MKAQIVSFHCILKNKIGKIISSTFNHDVITYAEKQGELLKGLVEGLQNLQTGEKRLISLTAEQAYGFYNPQLVIEVLRQEIPRGGSIHIGNQVIAEDEEGELRTFRVIQTSGHSVTLDGNHPLAGEDLVFEIETTQTREATHEEIAESTFQDLKPYFH